MNEIASPELDWWTLLTDPDYLTDPHPHLKRIREKGQVHYDPASDIYFVLGHEAFSSMVRAPQMGRDTRLWTNGWSRPESKQRDPLSYELFSEFQRQMVNSDQPDHRRMRDVYEKAFRPADIPPLRPMIEAEARKLAEDLPDGTPVEFMTAFANHLPLRVVRNLFQISPDMDPKLAEWNAALVKIGDIMMSQEQKREALEALRAYKDFLRGHLEACRGNPDNRLIGLAIEALDNGIMDEDETLNNLKGLVSGNETTVNVLGNGLLTLVNHPDAMQKLRSEPALMRTAIEEILRYEPAINFILRVAIEDFDCCGTSIPKGSLALGLICAINRDPERFSEAESFDIARRPNAQYIFGGGPHVCIGAALARLEVEVALSVLLERFSRIELTGDPVWWTDRTNQRGLQSLPVRFTR
ncbi:cytochrome P450 [Roseibium aggregatum]|uniref:Cytochrome P450 n=1 Tax=Roseibium aggregatum TaxID=187304 RepID=A0A939ECK0_9HYPH|nr:cytochrome P450 [Roseibium aggregatum]MBN9669593.1 cytochrome P450 [Roseibium aggregatum]